MMNKNNTYFENLYKLGCEWEAAREERRARKQTIIDTYGWDSEELKAWYEEEEKMKFPFSSGANKAYRAWRCEKNGVKLSLLAVCEHEFGLASETSAGTAALDMARLADAIERERAVSDFVLIFAHGGCEFCPVPSPKTMAR